MFLKYFNIIVRNILKKIIFDEQLLTILLSLIIGTLAAYAAISFKLIFEILQKIFYGTSLDSSIYNLENISWILILIVPSIGGLAVGLLIYFFMPNKRSTGVADIIIYKKNSYSKIPISETIKGSIINFFSIGIGASVGREGPVVHLGGAITTYVTDKLKLNPNLSIVLLGCGVASAVSASFNAPIAGVFFAIEVVIRKYNIETFTPIVISSVIGTIISRLHFGSFTEFNFPNYNYNSIIELPAFFVLGIISAIIAISLIKTIFYCDIFYEKNRIPIWARPAIGGFLVGLIGLYAPQILGVGYLSTNSVLVSSIPFWVAISLIIAKTAATGICLGSRFGGGIFSPSIFIGAMLGYSYGVIINNLFPDFSTNISLYALVGMGSVAAPVLGAPISTIMIAFELTGQFEVIIASMLSISISCLIYKKSKLGSFFDIQSFIRKNNN